MYKVGEHKESTGQSPINVNVFKPSGISSIFNWFGKKNNNEVASSVKGKNCFKFKLKSLDLDSLNINSDDKKVLKNTLKMKKNGPKANIFRIPKNQLGMSDEEFYSNVIAPHLLKSRKGQTNGEKCTWSASSLSITSKQKTHKTSNFRTVGRIKSHRSLVKNSSSSSKTTLKVHYKKSSKLNIPKPKYNSILMKSIPPNILKSNIENPIFVPIRCIGKINTESATKANETNCVEQEVLKDLETKTKVIPVLMKTIKSMEDQISTISSTTKQIKEAVTPQNWLHDFNSKNKEQTDMQLTLEGTQAQKILLNTTTKKNKRVKSKRIKTRGQSLASRRSPFNSTCESCKNLNFVFEPNSHSFSTCTIKDETRNPFNCQTLPIKEYKLEKEANEPIKTLFDAYPNVGCDTILKMYMYRYEETDSARPRPEVGNSCHKIEMKEGSENNPFTNLFKNIDLGEIIDGKDGHQFLQQFHASPSKINECEVFDLTSNTGHSSRNLIDLSGPLENNSLPVNPSVSSVIKAKLTENVLLRDRDVSKETEVNNNNLVIQVENCPKCRCSIAAIASEELNDESNEGEKNENHVMNESTFEFAIEPQEIRRTGSRQSFADYKSCEDLLDTVTKMSASNHDGDNAGMKESENCHDTQQQNIFDWIQNVCSNKDNKPEVSITIQVKDKSKCLILESVSPKLFEAGTNEKLNDGIHKETVNEGYLSGVSKPKVQSYNTRSILTTSEGIHDTDPSRSSRLTPIPKYKEYSKTISTDDIPLKTREFEKKDRQFHSLEHIKHAESFELESAGRGDVHVNSPKSKACWSPGKIEWSNIGREEKYCVFNGRCDYLDRNKRAIFDEQIQSKKSISDADNHSPRVSLVHLMVDDGIGDSMLESFDTKHYRLSSDNVNKECPCLMQLGDNNGINMSSEILKFQDCLPTLTSHLESKCFRYDSVLGNSPSGNTSVELVEPKLTQSSGVFRCIETDSDLEKDMKIEVDLKRRHRQQGLILLQDIEEIIDESEEEIDYTVNSYEHKIGDSIEIPTDESACDYTKNTAENLIVVPDVNTHKSSASVQTDWSLIGVSVDHFRSLTCLANRYKPSVGCQTEEVIEDDNGLVFSSNLYTDSMNSSKFCGTPSDMILGHTYLNYKANSCGENTDMKVSELFLNVIQQNSELENNMRDMDIAKPLDTFDNVEKLRELVSMVSANKSSLKADSQGVKSYGFEINALSAGYKSDTKHTCSHPCFPSFSDETIDSNVNISGSDAIIQPSTYGSLSNVSLINSDIINIGNNNESNSFTHPHGYVDVNSQTNSFFKESSYLRSPAISNNKSVTQTCNDYADVYRFGSHDYSSNSVMNFGNLKNTIVESTPDASVGEINDTTKFEGTSIKNDGAVTRTLVTHNSYVVNYLYNIEYDSLKNTVCHYE